MASVGIVGSAFRDNDARNKLSPGVWNSIVNDITTRCKPYKIAVSGGSSGIDHAAVCLFLNGDVEELVLCLPCEFINGKFLDNGQRGTSGWHMNPGYYLNFLHRLFSAAIGRNTLQDLATALSSPKTTVVIEKGFHTRNTKIAQRSDFLFAYTFSTTNVPDDGGTRDTWTKSEPGKRQHVSLTDFYLVLKLTTSFSDRLVALDSAGASFFARMKTDTFPSDLLPLCKFVRSSPSMFLVTLKPSTNIRLFAQHSDVLQIDLGPEADLS